MVRTTRNPAALPPRRAWPAATVDFARPQRALNIALAISVTLHAIVLSIQFKLPQLMLNKVRDSQLEVVLVNSKTQARPLEAQARAQANLDGGGNTDENRRAKTPLPAAPREQQGDQLLEARQRVREREARQKQLLADTRRLAVPPEQTHTPPQPDNPDSVSGADLARSALAMARMEAQIARNIDAYNKRPRKHFIGARVTEAIEAMYTEDWRQKVERVGNLNYPQSAKGRLYGSLVLSVSIRADGELESVEVNRSSGHKLLDDAATRIVRLAAPFGRFTEDMRRAYDILVITRTWTFTNTDHLASD